MKENIIIRRTEEKDLPSAVDIQIEGWKKAYQGIIADEILNSMDRETIIECRKKDYQEDGYIVAELNSEVVGFCRYIASNKYSSDMTDIDCEMCALYVKPDLKYCGIGTKMFRYVVEEFKSQNKTKMILWCLKDNEPSKKFYIKMGGTIIKEREVELGDKKYIEVGFVYNI